ncbi:uncharacterized protein LTHEOB_9768 [Neofusicoccum parvum]|nr:uncharacterized protein LTHEOB_9768 [Neofusicoccum parvum]
MPTNKAATTTNTTTPLRETDVLKPHDPKLTNEDEWEEFQLSAAEVLDSAGQPTSLLHADAASPVTVVGRVDALPREQAHLLAAGAPRPFPRGGAAVSLRGVTRFAYGQYEDGEVAIWAAGRAGWYKLAPARAYAPVFAGMVDAITILYHLADVYRGAAADVGARAVFRRYAAEHPNRCASAKAAAEAVYAHREFLLLSMLRGNELEDPAWSDTDIFLHLKSRFPEDFAAMERKEAGKAGKDKRKKVKRVASAQGSQDAESTDDARRKGVAAKPGAAPKKDDNWWETKVIWEMMQKVQIQGLIAPRNMTVEGFAKVMVRKFEVDDEGLAADYIKAHAPNLMYMIEHKRKPAVEWTETPVYTELAQVRLSASALRRTSELEIRRRKDPLPDPEPELDQDQDESNPSSEDIPAPAPRQHLDEHNAKRKEAVELARSEEMRSNLPVSNLIKRIREMADSQQNMQLMGLAGFGVANEEQSFPQPIRRQF